MSLFNLNFFIFLAFFCCYSANATTESTESELDNKNNINSNAESRYRQFQGWLTNSARQMDDFFGEEGVVDEEPWSQIRLSATQNVRESGNNAFDFKIRGKVRLPKLRHRAALVFEGDGNNESDDETVSGEVDTNSDSSAGAALMLDVGPERSRRVRYFLGIHGGLTNTSVYVKAQYLREWYSSRWDLRFKPDIEYDTRESLFIRVPLYVERMLREDIYYRNTTRLRWYEKEEGLFFDVDFTLFKKLHKYKYLALDLLNNYQTESKYGSGRQSSLIQARFRKAIWKKRMFFEVAPGVLFEKENDFEPEGVAYFRLELVSESLKKLELKR